MKNIAALRHFILISVTSILITGCSPTSLFSGGEDASIEALPRYRRVNSGCSQIDLSHSTMDIKTARKFVECLNAGGAMENTAKLVRAMNDEELAPIVDSLNRSILNAPQNLYQLEQTFEALNSQRVLDSSLESMGQLLQNNELITRSLGLFKSSFVDSNGKIDPLLLKAIKKMSVELSTDKVADTLDLALVATRAQAFSSLWDRLNATTIFGGPRHELGPEVAEALIAYGQSSSRLGRELIDLVIQGPQGPAFQLVDKIVPEDIGGVRISAAGWAAILNMSLAGEGRIAAQVSHLFKAMNQPIPCMQGARSMNTAAMDVIREMSEIPASRASAFIQRDKLVQIFTASPLCSFPAELSQNYPAMIELASSSAITPMADLIKATYDVQGAQSSRPMATYLIEALSDPGFRTLLPAMSELKERGAWEDLLLLATLPKVKDRRQIIELLQRVVSPLQGNGSASTLDVLVDGFTRVRASDLTAWLKSFRKTELGLVAAFEGVRTAFYINDAHPVLDLVRGAMEDAPSNPRLMEAFLKLSARPEFSPAVLELSAMSRKSDGRLKDLLQTTLNLFHRYAARGYRPIVTRPATQMPTLKVQARHNLAAADLQGVDLTVPAGDFGPCRDVNLAIRWDDLSNPQFEEQLQKIAACANGDGNYSQVAESLRFLTEQKTDSSAAGGTRSIHALLVESWNSMQFTREESRTLADIGFAALADKRVDRVLNAIPILFNQGVVRPLISLAEPIINEFKARSGLKRLGAFGATVLRRPDIQSTLAFADDLFRKEFAPAPPARARAYDEERISRWVSNKECNQQSDPALRTREIIDEYENAAINHGPLVNAKIRRHWTLDELKTVIGPVFAKFSNPAEQGPALKAILKLAARFGDPEQYPKGYLEKWLRDRANDKRLTSYIYPGESLPRVRLVNGLDRLAMVLLNADIYMPPPFDIYLGMDFLGQIADSWGDEPYEKWPAEIKAKFPPEEGNRPPTLAEKVEEIIMTVDSFAEMVGYPVIPPCQEVADPRDPQDVQDAETSNPSSPATGSQTNPEAQAMLISMYNIKVTMSVLKENAENGGMRVLRDFFYELYYSTPEEFRNSSAGDRNNLSALIKLVNSGLLRQAGMLMEGTAEDDEQIHGFFESLIAGAKAPETATVADSLFVGDSEQKLVWGVLKEILALEKPEDIDNAKKLGFYLMSSLSSLGLEVVPPAMKSIDAIVREYKGFLADHTDLVGDALKWDDLTVFLRALAEDRSAKRDLLKSLALDTFSEPQHGLDLMAVLAALDSSPEAHQAWTDFRDRFKALDNLPEFRALHLSEIGRQGLNFIEGRQANGSPLPAHELELSRKLVLTLATQMERGDGELADQLLALAARKPEETYRLLESISRLVQNGEIPRFLEIVQKNLSVAQ